MSKPTQNRLAAIRPRNGETKEWRRHPWHAHCGIWWAWTTWHVIDGEHRPAIAKIHVVTIESCGEQIERQETRYHCGECGAALSFLKTLPFHDDLGGAFVRFRPAEDPLRGTQAPIAVNETCTLIAYALEPFLGTHLSIEAGALGRFDVEDLKAGRYPVLDDALSADFFVVRIHQDEARPIDRGGAIYGTGFGPTSEAGVALYPAIPATLVLRNVTATPVPIPRCALFGLPTEIAIARRAARGRPQETG